MVVPFPTPRRSAPPAQGQALGRLLAHLHGAGDGEDIEAAVARLEAGERAAVIASLQRLTRLLDAPAPERLPVPPVQPTAAVYIPY